MSQRVPGRNDVQSFAGRESRTDEHSQIRHKPRRIRLTLFTSFWPLTAQLVDHPNQRVAGHRRAESAGSEKLIGWNNHRAPFPSRRFGRPKIGDDFDERRP